MTRLLDMLELGSPTCAYPHLSTFQLRYSEDDEDVIVGDESRDLDDDEEDSPDEDEDEAEAEAETK